MKPQHLLVYSLKSWRRTTKDQLQQLHRYVLAIIIAIIIPTNAVASVSCKSKFVNPISDICWSCLLPISIGPLKVGGGMSPAKRDTKNPSSPLCACSKGGQPVPIPGISLGFWEPARMVDVTRNKYCMVGLGIDLGGNDISDTGAYNRAHGKGRTAHNSFYHLHYYVYPLIYWLELITDLICLEQTSFDVAYLSELDPMWNDEKIQTLLNPEAFLFGNPAAQAACALDCVAASVDMPRDELFWCSGCWGNIYPFSGANADHVGGVQNSSLLTSRILAKMHRVGLAKSTSTTDASINGKICKKHTALKIKKSQYKLQMVYPKSSRGAMGCWPIGLSDMAYSSFKEYPWDGQDWSYVIWRKRSCCAF
jgi:conjugal transfer pilus assembly protein TraU